MKKTFEVLSSDGITTYVVEFSLDSGKLYIYCGCPAGMLGKWCKHKMRLISGDFSGVIATSGATDCVEAHNWVKNSEFSRLLDEMKLADSELQLAKIKMDNLKKALEKAAKKGVTA